MAVRYTGPALSVTQHAFDRAGRHGFGLFNGFANICQHVPLSSCPQCHTPVSANDKNCRACGVNLVLAAVLAERHSLPVKPVVRPGRISDLPRFSEFLVNQGYVTSNDLALGLAGTFAFALPVVNTPQ